MATEPIKKSKIAFEVKNEVLKVGEYAIEGNNTPQGFVPTGGEKQGIGKPYKVTPYSTVNVNSEGSALSAGALTPTNLILKPLTLISGAIDGVNDTYVWSGKPVQINLNQGFLTEGNGFTIIATNTSKLDTIPFTGQKLTAQG